MLNNSMFRLTMNPLFSMLKRLVIVSQTLCGLNNLIFSFKSAKFSAHKGKIDQLAVTQLKERL